MPQHDPDADTIEQPAARDPMTDSGVHEMPDLEPASTRDPCPVCFGTGHVMTTNDILRQSLQLLGDDPHGHQTVVAEFYRRLLTAAPHLVELFPADLTDPMSSGEGKDQRDLLVRALLDIGTLYDPDHPDSEAMKVLDTRIASWGNSHASFYRQSLGKVRPASVFEYGAVFNLLMATLHDATGAAWRPVFDVVWEEAYDHVARGMIAAAWEFDAQHGRTVRNEDYGKGAADAEHERRMAQRGGI
jgi:hemoglobin-like flavoprotein